MRPRVLELHEPPPARLHDVQHRVRVLAHQPRALLLRLVKVPAAPRPESRRAPARHRRKGGAGHAEDPRTKRPANKEAGGRARGGRGGAGRGGAGRHRVPMVKSAVPFSCPALSRFHASSGFVGSLASGLRARPAADYASGLRAAGRVRARSAGVAGASDKPAAPEPSRRAALEGERLRNPPAQRVQVDRRRRAWEVVPAQRDCCQRASPSRTPAGAPAGARPAAPQRGVCARAGGRARARRAASCTPFRTARPRARRPRKSTSRGTAERRRCWTRGGGRRW